MVSFVKTHKTLFISLGFLVLFGTTVTFATPPGSPYAAGATLNPACAPGTSNCTVAVNAGEVPLTFSTGLTRTSNTITNNLSTGVAGGQTIYGGTGTTDGLSLVGTTGNGASPSAAFSFKVANNGAATAMTILNNGNVGIGATTPSGILTLAGNRSSTQWGLNGIGLQVRGATYTDTNSTGTVGNVAINSIAVPALASTNAAIFTNASTLYIASAPGAAANATITNPWALYVNTGDSYFGGNKIVVGNNAGSEKISMGTNSGTMLAFNRDVSTGAIYDTNGYAFQFSHFKSIIPTTDKFSLTVFNPNGSQGATPIVVNASGQVGINNATLTQAFNVAGNIQISGNGNGLYFPDGSFISSNAGGVGVGTTSTTDLSFSADSDANGSGVINFGVHGTGAMTIANNGFVGVNTTSPTQALTVNGNLQITGQGNGIYFSDGSFMGSAANIGTGISAPGDISLVADTDQDGVGTIGLSTASVNHFLMVNSGNIAIGDTSVPPSTTMQIRSTTGNGVVIGTNSYPSFLGTNGLYVQGNFHSNTIVIDSGASINWGSSTARIFGNSTGTSSYLSFYTGATAPQAERMRIIDNGNVGIGNIAPNYLFVAGSTAINSGTVVAEFQNAGGTCDLDPSTTGGLSCSSDMTLKKNISLLTDSSSWNFNTNIVPANQSVLAKVLALAPVTYNWNVESDAATKHAGFIAQEVQQVFPDLVQRNPNTNTLSLNYVGMVPYTVEAIKEMNVNITSIADLTKTNTWRDSITAWLGNSTNGITAIFSKKVTTDQLCVGTVCVTQDQFMKMVQNSSNAGSTTVTGGGSSAPADPVVSDPVSDVPSTSTPTDTATQSPQTDAPTVSAPAVDAPVTDAPTQ